MAYNSRRRGCAAGLGIFDMAAGQRADNVAGEMRAALGRGQCCALLALEVIVQNQLVVAIREDQVDARALVVAAEQQMDIGNDNGVRRSVGRK